MSESGSHTGPDFDLGFSVHARNGTSLHVISPFINDLVLPWAVFSYFPKLTTIWDKRAGFNPTKPRAGKKV